MNTEKIYAALNDIFRELFANDDIVLLPGTTAEHIDGWDSITNISIMLAIETRFAIKFRSDEIEAMKNVGDLASSIESKLPIED